MPHGFQSRQDFKFSNLCYGSSSGTSAITSEMSQFSVSQILIRVGMEICSPLPMLAIWFVVKCAWSRKSFLLMFLSISVFQSGLQLIFIACSTFPGWGQQEQPRPYGLSTIIPPPLRKHNALLQFFSKNCGIHNAFVLNFLYINLGVKCFMP